jgi:hypothetical protein
MKGNAHYVAVNQQNKGQVRDTLHPYYTKVYKKDDINSDSLQDG